MPADSPDEKGSSRKDGAQPPSKDIMCDMNHWQCCILTYPMGSFILALTLPRGSEGRERKDSVMSRLLGESSRHFSGETIALMMSGPTPARATRMHEVWP